MGFTREGHVGQLKEYQWESDVRQCRFGECRTLEVKVNDKVTGKMQS